MADACTGLPPALALECAQLNERASAGSRGVGLPTQTDPNVLDPTAAFVQLCALLTDPDTTIRRDACRLLARVPYVPTQRLAQAVSKRPLQWSMPGGARPAAKVPKPSVLHQAAGATHGAFDDFVLSAEDEGSGSGPEERVGLQLEEASQGGLVIASEATDVPLRMLALSTMACFARQGVEAAAG